MTRKNDGRAGVERNFGKLSREDVRGGAVPFIVLLCLASGCGLPSEDGKSDGEKGEVAQVGDSAPESPDSTAKTTGAGGTAGIAGTAGAAGASTGAAGGTAGAASTAAAGGTTGAGGAGAGGTMGVAGGTTGVAGGTTGTTVVAGGTTSGAGSTTPALAGTTPFAACAREQLCDVVALDIGLEDTCALTSTGSWKCWGGTLGRSPTQVSGFASGVAAIGQGSLGNCAILTDGTMRCFGQNRGELGKTGAGGQVLTVPASITDFGGELVQFRGGSQHACTLNRAGEMLCLGRNNYAALGNGEKGDETVVTPVRPIGLPANIRHIAVTLNMSCALNTEGRVWCWGDGSLAAGPGEAVSYPQPYEVTAVGTGVTTIEVGDNARCVLKNGAVLCWGSAPWSGTGTTRWTPAPLKGLESDVEALHCGRLTCCAVTRAGAAKCWGKHSDVKGVGDGTENPAPAPVDVLSSGVRAVYGGYGHSCAIMSNGGVKCWGDNKQGQLGDGTTKTRFSPVDVVAGQ